MQKDLKDKFKSHRTFIGATVTDSVKDSTNDRDNNNTSDITKLIEMDKPKYTDTRSRITPYIKSEVLQEFKEICGNRKGLQSEIIERLLIQFIADVKEKRKVPDWDIPERR